MSLRIRLVASLAALFTVGLIVYGLGTYRAFEAAELGRLDHQLTATVDLITPELFEGAGTRPQSQAAAPRLRPAPEGRPRPEVVVPPGTYAELRRGTRVLHRIQALGGAVQPDVDDVTSPDQGARITTVGATTGNGRWRVLATHINADQAVVVGVPLAQVSESLSRLLTIETLAGLGLLVLLGGGAWVLLRRGLRPLEQIAATAGAITPGQLDRRVPHADGRSEVGQLATALNGMLDDLERAFDERVATEAKLRRFLADASHELRTPLTSIRGFAELFRLGADSPQVDLPTIMRRIEQESGRMSVLVNDLLTLARLDELRPIAHADVDLAVLAADACSDAMARDPARPLTFDAAGPVIVTGDGDQLRQALTNLVTNAMRHTAAGTAVTVRAFADSDTARLEVADRGPGLDDEALAHVFDRFWQADVARAGTGAGLGLAIVASIAAAHGGTVEASNGPNGGAVFTMSLPRAPKQTPT